MHSVLLGFLLIWVSSFLIFAWLVWRAPMMEDFLDDGDPPDSLRKSGPRKSGRGSEQTA